MAAIDRYNENLSNPQAPGTGCHNYLMSTANLGVMAGIDPQQIQTDIRRVIPAGTRAIRDKEINAAINKAMMDHSRGTFTPRPQPKPIIKNSDATLQKIIKSAVITTQADLWEDSPVRLTGEPAEDAVLLMETRYDGNDLLWTADRHEPGTPSTIRPVCEWISLITAGKIELPPFFIINPLTGLPAPKKSGDGITYRGDDNIKRFRYCMAEFDNLSREDQIKFWSACKLPIRALIDSGNKSIHALIDIQKLANVQTLTDWATHIKGRLYNQILVPMGVDAACSNPSRLSRLPGHYREEKKSFQRLLWLSPKEDEKCQR
jgi:hypothetical protein